MVFKSIGYFYFIILILLSLIQIYKYTNKWQTIDYFKFFIQTFIIIPDILNKNYLKLLIQLSHRQNYQNNIYKQLRKQFYIFIKNKLTSQNQRNLSQNQKIVAVVFIFKLQKHVVMDQLVKLIPAKRLNQYINSNINMNNNCVKDQKNKNQENIKIQVQEQCSYQQQSEKQKVKINNSTKNITQSMQKQQQNQKSSSSQLINLSKPIPHLLNLQILRLIQQSNDKQVVKLLKHHKISPQQYPQFIDKLEYKYLYHIEKQPTYFIQFLIDNKLNLIEKVIEIYRKKKNFNIVEHFVNRFYAKIEEECMKKNNSKENMNNSNQTNSNKAARRLSQNLLTLLKAFPNPNPSKILPNILLTNDKFGPTQSHVLSHNLKFLSLSQFNLTRQDIYFITSSTITRKQQKNALIELIQNSKQIGIDSQNTSGIHILQKGRLEIIQVYSPTIKKVFLFDVQDFKRNKKMKYKNSEKKNNNVQVIEVQPDMTTNSSQSLLSLQKDGQKLWSKFCKIIKILFKNCTIYGHVLHSDIPQILQSLNLHSQLKPSQLKIKDSQLQFKKKYPKQNKSKLSYLSEFILKKQISKFQQCSAWDYRPLRQAQIHYAAMDCVLPYILVKQMQKQIQCQKVIQIKQQ